MHARAVQFLLGLSTMAVWVRLPLGPAEEGDEEVSPAEDDGAEAVPAAGMEAAA